jgi:two-component system, LytTR family, response regulator
MKTGSNILALQHSCGTAVIDIGTIIRIEAISNYSKLFFTDGKTLVVAKVLKWFEPLLAEKGFLRVHRSHLVNTAWIETALLLQSKIILRNNVVIAVSRRKRSSIIQYLQLTIAA